MRSSRKLKFERCKHFHSIEQPLISLDLKFFMIQIKLRYLKSILQSRSSLLPSHCTSSCVYRDQFLLSVVVDGDGFGRSVEGFESFSDSGFVVVDSSRSLATIQQTARHFRVGKIEIQYHLRRTNCFLELNALVNLEEKRE